MGITEEMLSDRVPDTEYDSFSTYRILDFVKYEQDLYMVSTYEYDDPSFGINMYRYGESDPVDLDLRWNTECGNLPYMMSISFREELLYSSKS